ncbi:hypothetical protein MINS_12430 [Mycolicibacterium insubricum]|uniref:Uncharacterized protein n=1 Tax=Mycolicibacterium insubricum TaxID=444597 RepID=A0A1X0CRU0_9MYCO|nr:hypothetical protein [Mycolicibacterium insubricum]MCV7080279.1 hypothetical protein [Mycolicibacterium insubricum]ORA62815.1 hypothetical protein BST26_20640 [Mycolicibacterium insubricum]BBZ65814.1 hypothetical protein MINS_12430 [Mycolicibacterium insubricum]
MTAIRSDLVGVVFVNVPGVGMTQLQAGDTIPDGAVVGDHLTDPNEPTEDNPTEDEPTEDNPTEDEPTEDNPTEDEPTEEPAKESDDAGVKRGRRSTPRA